MYWGERHRKLQVVRLKAAKAGMNQLAPEGGREMGGSTPPSCQRVCLQAVQAADINGNAVPPRADSPPGFKKGSEESKWALCRAGALSRLTMPPSFRAQRHWSMERSHSTGEHLSFPKLHSMSVRKCSPPKKPLDNYDHKKGL